MSINLDYDVAEASISSGAEIEVRGLFRTIYLSNLDIASLVNPGEVIEEIQILSVFLARIQTLFILRHHFKLHFPTQTCMYADFTYLLSYLGQKETNSLLFSICWFSNIS